VAAFYAFAKPFFYRRRPFHDGGLKVRLLPPHFHPQLETIVYRISEVLLAAEIPLGHLYQCRLQQELNLLQLTTTVMTQLRACSASREARCAPDPPSHNRSEPHTRPHSGRYPSPNLPRPGDCTEYPSLPDTGRSGPLFRGYTGSLLRYGLSSCSPPRTDLTTNLPQPTGTFTPELPASRSPFSPSGITTVATERFHRWDFHPLESQLASLHRLFHPLLHVGLSRCTNIAIALIIPVSE
jgi:hypothetical protein